MRPPIHAMHVLAVTAALSVAVAGGQPAPGMHRIAFVNIGDAARSFAAHWV